MRTKKRLQLALLSAAVFVTLVILASVGLVWNYGPNFNVYLAPPSPQRYGEVALRFIDANGLYSDNADWGEAKAAAQHSISEAESYDEVLSILSDCIVYAGGKHSYVTSASEQTEDAEVPAEMPTYELSGGMLILRIPEFLGTQDEAQHYMDLVSGAIAREEYAGIILDLSANRGGDMSPMIVGLAQLLPNGELFSYVDRFGNTSAVTLKDGSIDAGGFDLHTPIPDTDKKLDIPIAIITGENTGSSGEMTLLCFRGLPNVRTFGQDTAGYATANRSFSLYDGASLQITFAQTQARTGEVFGYAPIAPDIPSADAMQEAITWLHEQG